MVQMDCNDATRERATGNREPTGAPKASWRSWAGGPTTTTASRRVRHSACEDPAEDRARDAGTSQR